jgi:hypothetical protein
MAIPFQFFYRVQPSWPRVEDLSGSKRVVLVIKISPFKGSCFEYNNNNNLHYALCSVNVCVAY